MHNIFNSVSDNVISLVFPDNDWRGYYYQIDSATYNIHPTTTFRVKMQDGTVVTEYYSGWRSRFYNYDVHSNFNIIP